MSLLRTLALATLLTATLGTIAHAQADYDALQTSALQAALSRAIEANPGNPNATIPVDDGKPSQTTLLIYAVFIGEDATAKKLVAQGAHTDALDRSNRSSLYYAIFNQNYDMVQFLLAQPSTKSVLETTDEMGDTPLYLAIGQSDPAIVKALIKAGAKVDLDHPFMLGQTIRSLCKNPQGRNACAGLPSF